MSFGFFSLFCLFPFYFILFHDDMSRQQANHLVLGSQNLHEGDVHLPALDYRFLASLPGSGLIGFSTFMSRSDEANLQAKLTHLKRPFNGNTTHFPPPKTAFSGL
jgi:hypothetical protein